MKKMDDVKKINLRKYDKSSVNFNQWIIYQEDGDLISSGNGRSKIMNEASIWKDIVLKSLDSND